MILTIELYGRLRDALGRSAEVEVSEGASAAEVLRALGVRLGPAGAALSGAALATETEVLAGSAVVPGDARLAALPPVCGG